MSKSILHEVDGNDRPLIIRWSTEEDIQKIHEWLQIEEKQGVHGNFLCNWDLTAKCHREGKLLVLLDVMNDIPIGYQWGQLLHSGVLQIRNDWRGKGLGRLVVEHCIELALEQDEMVLEIECKPSSSIPFWNAMGFTIFEDENRHNTKGYRTLAKPLILPDEGIGAEVRISAYPEERKWCEEILPTSTFSPHALRSRDGKIYFAERIAFPSEIRDAGRDSVIEIVVGSDVVYRDKAKYEEAQYHGVQKCRNGFFIDWVVL